MLVAGGGDTLEAGCGAGGSRLACARAARTARGGDRGAEDDPRVAPLAPISPAGARALEH
eukprot:2818646-Pyramimonas_sp.AAC.1